MAGRRLDGRDHAVLIVAAWVAYQRTQASVSRYGIVERGFFGGTYTVAARDIEGVLRVQLYRSNSLDTTQELFVVSRTGRACSACAAGSGTPPRWIASPPSSASRRRCAPSP